MNSDLVRSAQIFSCSMAAAREGIAGGDHDLQTRTGQFRRQLADRRRLARTVDADDEDDMRLVAEIELQWLGDRPQHLGDFLRHDPADILACHILAVALRGQRIGDPHRRLDAKIGLDQQILQILQRLIVQLALGEKRRDLAGELRRGARKTGT